MQPEELFELLPNFSIYQCVAATLAWQLAVILISSHHTIYPYYLMPHYTIEMVAELMEQFTIR